MPPSSHLFRHASSSSSPHLDLVGAADTVDLDIDLSTFNIASTLNSHHSNLAWYHVPEFNIFEAQHYSPRRRVDPSTTFNNVRIFKRASRGLFDDLGRVAPPSNFIVGFLGDRLESRGIRSVDILRSSNSPLLSRHHFTRRRAPNPKSRLGFDASHEQGVVFKLFSTPLCCASRLRVQCLNAGHWSFKDVFTARSKYRVLLKGAAAFVLPRYSRRHLSSSIRAAQRLKTCSRRLGAGHWSLTHNAVEMKFGACCPSSRRRFLKNFFAARRVQFFLCVSPEFSSLAGLGVARNWNELFDFSSAARRLCTSPNFPSPAGPSSFHRGP
ncbi:hypothetical protein C8R46DRAFT_1025467 [Mycena filopes]|nr:hypothetical protein C8R46DRAFT_1025467 [Mycena filopes]